MFLRADNLINFRETAKSSFFSGPATKSGGGDEPMRACPLSFTFLLRTTLKKKKKLQLLGPLYLFKKSLY